jgi:hypothetical protein
LHEGEQPLFTSQVLIEDKHAAKTGRILLKERYAVLCPTRLLLFKKSTEKKPVRMQQVMAVYPLVNSDFELIDAPRLTSENISCISNIEHFNNLTEIANLREFLRISFSEVAQVRDNAPTQATNKVKRDFYFGKLNTQWLLHLRLAKKAIHDALNLEKSVLRSSRRSNWKKGSLTAGSAESKQS